jgi:hypothetical protein
MKIKCINIYNKITKKFEQTSKILTIGKEYIVLEIYVFPKRDGEEKILYRLNVDKTGTPGLFEFSQFELISEKLPSNWVIAKDNNTLIFAPKSWQEKKFWDDFFNGDKKALEIYHREADIIASEEGWSYK